MYLYYLGDGKYKQKAQEKGIECIEFNFEIKNTFEIEKVDKVIDIIKEKNIDEIHVHKFICIPLMLMVCAKTKIPYIAYVHDGLTMTYDWFVDNFNIYNLALKLFFQNAYKVIFITDKVKEYNKNKFEIDDKKCLVRKNSINFDIYKSNLNIEKNLPENFLLVSRIAHEKFQSIKNAIDVFVQYSKKVDFETKLTIIGEGDKEEELLNIIKEKEGFNIEYKGSTSDVVNFVNENDVIFGLGRCIIEAIAIKRIAIISGYEYLKGIVTAKNIEKALDENLSGRNLDNLSIEEQVNELLSLNKEKITQITEENYEVIFKELDINKNVYSIPEDATFEDMDYTSIYHEINKMSEKIESLKQEKEEIWKARVYFEEQNKNKDIEIEKLKLETNNLMDKIQNIEIENQNIKEEKQKNDNELKSIKNDKIYRIIQKIRSFTRN